MEIKLYQLGLQHAHCYGRYGEYRKQWDKYKKAGEASGAFEVLPLEECVYREQSEEDKAAGKEPESEYCSRYILEDREKVWVTGEQLLILMEHIDVQVTQTLTKNLDISQAIVGMAAKETIQLQGTGGNTYNSRCEVHMPGQALSQYNEVCLLEDACSDALQGELSNGWRIIAACPQPDQRRPDYILGRWNPDHQADGSGASRGGE